MYVKTQTTYGKFIEIYFVQFEYVFNESSAYRDTHVNLGEYFDDENAYYIN